METHLRGGIFLHLHLKSMFFGTTHSEFLFSLPHRKEHLMGNKKCETLPHAISEFLFIRRYEVSPNLI
jgi:hypothetical protein